MRYALYGIRQVPRRRDMEFRDTRPLIMPEKMRQQADIVDSANKKLQVYSPGLGETFQMALAE